ncbi:MAG: formate dehydrogenase subunit delta [Proteobacteria bacterium]|nr:formate dehydrogenase subunit delta [Pseudomonadota bacterium]
MGSCMDSELKHLIKMLNEISANLARGEGEEQAAARVADHLKRFWAPAMRAKIAAYGNSDGDELVAVSKQALSLLRFESAASA